MTVRMHGPWVPFPQFLTSQVGVVMAPSRYCFSTSMTSFADLSTISLLTSGMMRSSMPIGWAGGSP